MFWLVGNLALRNPKNPVINDKVDQYFVNKYVVLSPGCKGMCGLQQYDHPEKKMHNEVTLLIFKVGRNRQIEVLYRKLYYLRMSRIGRWYRKDCCPSTVPPRKKNFAEDVSVSNAIFVRNNILLFRIR